MIRWTRRLWWRLRRHGRPWTQATAEAVVRRELERFLARVTDAGLPVEIAYPSVAATLLAQTYGATLLAQGPAQAHLVLQQVLGASSDQIARLIGTRPFEIQKPPPTDAGMPDGPPAQP